MIEAPRIGIDPEGNEIDGALLADDGSKRVDTRRLPALHGAAGGVRDAAWLWPR